jgi:uncharacterized protein (DUF433 family)
MTREEFEQIVDRLKASYPVTEAQLKQALLYAAERFEDYKKRGVKR